MKVKAIAGMISVLTAGSVQVFAQGTEIPRGTKDFRITGGITNTNQIPASITVKGCDGKELPDIIMTPGLSPGLGKASIYMNGDLLVGNSDSNLINKRGILFHIPGNMESDSKIYDFETMGTGSGTLHLWSKYSGWNNLKLASVAGVVGVSGKEHTFELSVNGLQLFDKNSSVKKIDIGPDGNAFFDGKISAKEIEVMPNVWADNVFYDQYNLISIPELKQYITKNRKLPGVPSESEVKQCGMNIGDMNAVLLKKVEELTLYVIRQQQEIDALKQEVKKIQK
jgi:hypothetical protein